MNKSNEAFSLIYHQNIEFISGIMLQPAEEQEICKNIAYRLGVPYPYSVFKMIIYTSIAVVITSLLVILALLPMIAILSASVVGFQLVIFLFVGLVAIIIASLIVYRTIKMLLAPPDIVEATYQNMVKQHKIVHGEIDTIKQSGKETAIYYTIEGHSNNFTYVTKNFGSHVKLNSRIYILYLDDKIHAIL